MAKHFEERSVERYNLEITPDLEGNIIHAIRTQHCYYLYPSEENPRRHFVYVVYKGKPIKVLYHKSKKNNYYIVTAYPLDVDEYNTVKEKQEQDNIRKYIKFLKDRGYIVYKNWRKK